MHTFTTPNTPSDVQRWLVVSEVMYNPALPNPDAEFIEIHNTSSTLTLNLAGAAFTSGIDFTFPTGFTLAPGARAVIVLNAAAFAAAYPTFTGTILGPFTAGRLSNSGETLKLDDPTGSTVVEFTYGDDFPWPSEADGLGRSLSFIQPGTSATAADPANWRPSLATGGTPGSTDATVWNGILPEITLTWTPQGPVLNATLLLTADNVRFIPEHSSTLSAWNRTGFQAVASAAPPVPGIRQLSWQLPANLQTGPRAFVRLSVEAR